MNNKNNNYNSMITVNNTTQNRNKYTHPGQLVRRSVTEIKEKREVTSSLKKTLSDVSRLRLTVRKWVKKAGNKTV